MTDDKLFGEMLTFKDAHDRDELGMIISNQIDIMYEGSACVSIKKWPALTNSILRWHIAKIRRMVDYD